MDAEEPAQHATRGWRRPYRDEREVPRDRFRRVPAEDRVVVRRRPDPLCLPPPEDLFTVAQARLLAVLAEMPRRS